MAIEYPIWEQVNNGVGTLSKPVVGQVITAAATITPTYHVHHVTGSTSIVTITPPWTDFGGTLLLIADTAISWTAGGNITAAGNAAAGSYLFFTYDPSDGKFDAGIVTSGAGPGSSQGTFSLRVRTATAAVNTGATLVPAVPGLKIRLIDMAMISIGGAAATATTVDIKATQSAGSVKLFAVPVASLVQTAVVKPGTIAASGPLADGACFVANDVNTAVTIGSTTNNLSGSTNIDVVLTFTLDT